MKKRGFSLAEVSMATGVGLAITALGAMGGSYLMVQSKLAKLGEHGQKMLQGLDGYLASGGKLNAPVPMPALLDTAALENDLKPFMPYGTNTTQYFNPFQNATQWPVIMQGEMIFAPNSCTDGTLILDTSPITNTAYYGKVIYCYANLPWFYSNYTFKINDRGTLKGFYKYAVGVVDNKGYFSYLAGR